MEMQRKKGMIDDLVEYFSGLEEVDQAAVILTVDNIVRKYFGPTTEAQVFRKEALEAIEKALA